MARGGGKAVNILLVLGVGGVAWWAFARSKQPFVADVSKMFSPEQLPTYAQVRDYLADPNNLSRTIKANLKTPIVPELGSVTRDDLGGPIIARF